MPFCCQVHLPLRYHSKADTAEAKGNSLADHVAKTEALQNENKQLTTAFPFQPPSNLTDMVKFQGMAPENRHLDTQGRQPELTQSCGYTQTGGLSFPLKLNILFCNIFTS